MLGPFDDDDPGAVEDHVQSEIIELLGSIQSVQIHMVDGRRSMVLANQGERRTGDIPRRAGSTGDASGEHRLARTEITR